MTNFHVYYFEDQGVHYNCASWGDHMLATTLRIDNLSQSVSMKNEGGYGKWKHPMDIDIRTHLENGEPNP